jgi:hypothetical protein
MLIFQLLVVEKRIRKVHTKSSMKTRLLKPYTALSSHLKATNWRPRRLGVIFLFVD